MYSLKLEPVSTPAMVLPWGSPPRRRGAAASSAEWPSMNWPLIVIPSKRVNHAASTTVLRRGAEVMDAYSVISSASNNI